MGNNVGIKQMNYKQQLVYICSELKKRGYINKINGQWNYNGKEETTCPNQNCQPKALRQL